jgi:VWFA-related protein
MKPGTSVTVAATLAFGSALALADPPSRPAPVIQVGVDVIQIDATVTDKQGRPVTDLRPEEFRLKVDGKPLPVENAAFFGRPAAAFGVGPDAAADAAAASGPERSLVFLIDDLSMSLSSVYWARRALQEFASERDDDETMIGLRFTSDEGDKVLLSRNPARLDAAIEGFRYNPRRGNPFLGDANFQQRIYSLLTTINALRSAPGRKAVVLVSEGLSIESRTDSRDQFMIDTPFDALFADSNTDAAQRMIVEVANRASVVIHTMDPNVFISAGRMWLQGSLAQLASDTGGLSVLNGNRLKRGLRNVMEDQRSYYLIGFEPPKSAFSKSRGRPRFHGIELTVDRPGVRVRTRAGFYGVTDDDVRKRAPLSPPREPTAP